MCSSPAAGEAAFAELRFRGEWVRDFACACNAYLQSCVQSVQTTRHSKQKPASATDRISAAVAQGDGQEKPTTEKGVRETRDRGESARGEREEEEEEALERSAHLFIGRANNVHKWEGGGSSSLYDLRDRFASHDDDVAWHDYESMKAKYAAHTLNAAHTLTHKSASHTRHSIEREGWRERESEKERERNLYSIQEEREAEPARRSVMLRGGGGGFIPSKSSGQVGS